MALTHGKPGTYTSGGCRCAECSRAAAEHKRRRRAALAQRVHAEERTCEICGESMRRRGPETLAEFQKRRTCSDACKGHLTVQVRWDRNPHSVASRTLLARTCPECGALLPADRFKVDGRDGTRSRLCMPCSSRRAREGWSEEQLDRYRQRNAAKTAALQEDSIPTAHRRGYVWTGPEMELLATRDDLSVSDLAQMLGRTYASVVNMRRKLLVDPRKKRLAGAPR